MRKKQNNNKVSIPKNKLIEIQEATKKHEELLSYCMQKNQQVIQKIQNLLKEKDDSEISQNTDEQSDESNSFEMIVQEVKKIKSFKKQKNERKNIDRNLIKTQNPGTKIKNIKKKRKNSLAQNKQAKVNQKLDKESAKNQKQKIKYQNKTNDRTQKISHDIAQKFQNSESLKDLSNFLPKKTNIDTSGDQEDPIKIQQSQQKSSIENKQEEFQDKKNEQSNTIDQKNISQYQIDFPKSQKQTIIKKDSIDLQSSIVLAQQKNQKEFQEENKYVNQNKGQMQDIQTIEKNIEDGYEDQSSDTSVVVNQGKEMWQQLKQQMPGKQNAIYKNTNEFDQNQKMEQNQQKDQYQQTQNNTNMVFDNILKKKQEFGQHQSQNKHTNIDKQHLQDKKQKKKEVKIDPENLKKKMKQKGKLGKDSQQQKKEIKKVHLDKIFDKGQNVPNNQVANQDQVALIQQQDLQYSYLQKQKEDERNHLYCLEQCLQRNQDILNLVNSRYIINNGLSIFEKCILDYQELNCLKEYYYQKLSKQYSIKYLFGYISQGNLEAVYCCSKLGYNIHLWQSNDPDFPGETCLMYACRKSQYHIVRYFVEILRFDIEQVDYNCCTAIFYACQVQSIDIIKYLLKQQVNVNRQSKTGKIAYDYLEESSVWEIREFIEKEKLNILKPTSKLK